MATRTTPNSPFPFDDVPMFGLPSEGADDLYGFSGADTIHGLGGSDRIHGGSGSDFLFGDGGNDRLYGEAGNDTLDGGSGDDTLNGGAGADRLIGGSGVDTASYADATIGVSLSLANGGLTNDAAGDSYQGIENVTGSTFGDIIVGNGSSNRLEGGAGNDFLSGGFGNDVLIGGEGQDTLVGGDGDDRLVGSGSPTGAGFGNGDTMTGGFGNDTFVIRFELLDGGQNFITDFQRGVDILDVGIVAGDFGADGRLAIGSDSLGWSHFDETDQYRFNVETQTLEHVEFFFVEGFTPVVTLAGVTELSAADLI